MNMSKQKTKEDHQKKKKGGDIFSHSQHENTTDPHSFKHALPSHPMKEPDRNPHRFPHLEKIPEL